MVSTMEVESLVKLGQLEPDLRLGWTYPKTRRDWTGYGWAAPAVAAALGHPPALPPNPREARPEARNRRGLGIPPDHPPRLVAAAEKVGVELIAWTVDDAERIRELLAMGVKGICSNDPRLFEVAERQLAPETAGKSH